MAVQDVAGWGTPPPFLMGLLTQLGFLVCMGYFSVALATGLYYVAELAEESTKTARQVLKYWLLGIIGVHVLLYLFDGVPFLQTCVGILANVSYSLLLKTYPFTTLSAPGSILSFVFFFADTVLWYMYFTDPFTPGYTVSQIIGFFGTCVWPVPFGFFVTLSLADQNLPGLGNLDTGATNTEFKKRRGVLGMVDWMFKKEPSSAYTKGY
eukprot:TRINITY_DN5351_c0_g1_i1.p1 TRINITY_DN5351_c0_g1~~TRINITY_DN5351_c0_g1_i1.p1  ORF type:complete len:209 (+),score=79.99 TRINITY_DN5351_c0_g1_i1:64-690(+)